MLLPIVLMGSNSKEIRLKTSHTGASYDYVAKERIYLREGFQFRSSVQGHRNRFVARVDENLDVPHDYESFPPNPNRKIRTTHAVGATAGSFSVSPSGAGNYSIPIAAFPGVNGVQPSLAVFYSSQSDKGTLGYRWHLSGLSSVTRAGKAMYYDGKVQAPSLTNTDNLMLDGQRLILLSGENLSNNAEYTTEVESYNKIAYKNINGFLCLEVKTKDGKVYEYGSSSDSRIQTAGTSEAIGWMLTKVTDKNGNYMTYSYLNNTSTGECNIHKISYTGNSTAGVLPTNAVEFIYETKADAQKSYIAGKSIAARHTLKQILISSSNVVSKSYKFKYYFDGIFTKLTEVEEYGLNNTRYNSTVVDWGDYSNAQVVGKEYSAIIGDRGAKFISMYADFNGDGKTDLIQYPDKETYDGSEQVTLFIAEYEPGYSSVQFKRKATFPIPANFKTLSLGDFNGDGFMDLVYVIWEERDDDLKFLYEIQLFNPNTYSLSLAKTFRSITPRFIVGDFTGGGTSEVLIEYESEIYNHLGYVGGRGSNIDWNADHINSYQNGLIDFDGDGKTDLMMVNWNGYKVYSLEEREFILRFSGSEIKTPVAGYEYKPGDFNGDGKTDILVHNRNDNVYYLLFSTGTGFERKDLPDLEREGAWFTGDFNGDGRTDIASYRSYVNGTLAIFIGIFNGETFDVKRFDLSGTNHSYLFPEKLHFHDFDGDGITDFAGDFFSNALRVKMFPYKQNLFVKNIVDGFNRKTSIKYSSITHNIHPFYKEEGVVPSFPVSRSKFPLMVVTSVEQQAGEIGKSVLNYSYKNIRTHKQGKGLLCFEEVMEADANNALKTNTKYNYSRQYYYPYVESQVKSTSTNELISAATTEYNFLSLGQGRMFPYMSRQVQTDHLKNFTETTTYSNLYYGTPRSIAKTYSDGSDSEYLTLDYSMVDSNGKWLMVPNSTKTLVLKNSNAWVGKEVYAYDGKYNISKKETFVVSENAKESEEQFTYDRMGNVLSQSLTKYASLDTLFTSYVYSTDGKYLLQTTDPFGLTAKQSFNKYGQLATDTSALGNVTTYEYDDMGNLVRKVGGEVEEETSVKWYSGDEYLYAVIQKATGKPVVRTYYDMLDRETRTTQVRFDGSEQHVEKVYHKFNGLLTKTSLPFKGFGVAEYWNECKYDKFGRLTELNYASGKKDEYVYNGSAVTSIINGVETVKTTNAKGQLQSVSDPAGVTTYQYRPDGQPQLITAPGGVITSFEYDGYGRRECINDPSAGRKAYRYDSNGNISEEIDANNISTYVKYDSFGRQIYKVVEGDTTHYVYDATYNRLTAERNSNSTKEFYYDYLGRVSREKESIVDGKWLEKVYTYTSGALTAIDYTSQSGHIATENYQYSNGYLTEVKLNNTTSIWKLNTENSFGMPISASTGPLHRSYGYDNYGMPTARVISKGWSNLQNFSYEFNPQNGNLNLRRDNNRLITENFGYDELNRLESFGNTVMNYDVKGNITEHSGVGTYGYNLTGKPYAITDVTPYGDDIPLRNQSIRYSGMMRPLSIAENGDSVSFLYDGNGARVKMSVWGNGNNRNCYYLGGQYEVDSSGATVRERLYLDGDAYSAPAVYVRENGVWTVNYIGRDYLGSITHIFDVAGQVVQELSYDAWGRLRNPNSQQLYTHSEMPSLLLGRGYTGHEHLAAFGLINMNARLYDPVLGRFLSPDPYVLDMEYGQDFNRYMYARNNPLVYADPNGEWAHLLIGALAGGLINLIVNWDNIDDVWDGLAAFGIGAAAGALGAATGGAAFAAAGGAAGGIGGFLAGAASGMAGSAFSMPVLSMGNSMMFGTPMMTFSQYGMGILMGGLMGGAINGTIASLNGRSFWNGVMKNPQPTPLPMPNAPSPELKLPNNGRSEVQAMPAERVRAEQTIKPNNPLTKEITETTTRMGKDGKAVEVIFKDGSKMDINAARVKEWTPNTHPNAPAGTLQKIKFEEHIPNSKGYKRYPTEEELLFLNRMKPKK